MRPLAIVAAIVTVIAFLFWLSGWIFWNFLAREFAPGGSASTVMQVLSTAATLLEYLAVILICIALFFGGKKETAN